MIDYFALALIHSLIFIAIIQLAGRKDLDEDPLLPNARKKRLLRDMEEESASETGAELSSESDSKSASRWREDFDA